MSRKGRKHRENDAIEEGQVLFIDTKKIKSIDQFLLVVSKNLPVNITILKALEASIENGVLEFPDDYEADLIKEMLAVTCQRIAKLCQKLQDQSTLSEEEVVAQFTKDALNEAKRVVEASIGKPLC